jgi:hypothetical protein
VKTVCFATAKTLATGVPSATCGHAGDPCVGGDVCTTPANEDTDGLFFPPNRDDCDDGEFCNGKTCDGRRATVDIPAIPASAV